MVDGLTLVELAGEDTEAVLAAEGLPDEADGVARELLVGAVKGPMTPPCCCAGVVLSEVLAALALKMARDSDVLDL
jgi:hypothetical protein